MKCPSHRRVKKMLKANLRKTSLRRRIKILETFGKVLIIPPVKSKENPNIACIRYWSYIAIASNHPQLEEILRKSPEAQL